MLQNAQCNQGENSSGISTSPAPVVPTTPKTNIDFNYIVMLSGAPIYSYKSWNPQGHFMEKPLNELPLDNENIRGFIIRLEGPGVPPLGTLLRCSLAVLYEGFMAKQHTILLPSRFPS